MQASFLCTKKASQTNINAASKIAPKATIYWITTELLLGKGVLA